MSTCGGSHLRTRATSRAGPWPGSSTWARLARACWCLTGAGISRRPWPRAFLARSKGDSISERHVLAAARRELEKQGVVVRPGQLEPR